MSYYILRLFKAVQTGLGYLAGFVSNLYVKSIHGLKNRVEMAQRAEYARAHVKTAGAHAAARKAHELAALYTRRAEVVETEAFSTAHKKVDKLATLV